MKHLTTSHRIHPIGLVLIVWFFLTMPSKVVHADETFSAQNEAKAETAYKDAKTLMAQGKYPEACAMFEESNRLDKALGTQLELAGCYEQWGKLASAWALFIKVVDEAKRGSPRAQVAREHAAALEPRLPKLNLTVPASVASLPGVEVRDNGTVVNSPLWGKALPVDPGEHVITVSASGRVPSRQTRQLREGVSETVLIDDLSPESSKSYAGPIVLGAVGVASVVVGSVFGVRAFDKRKNADEQCVKAACKSFDDPVYDDTRTAAHVSTATFVVGGVALAGSAIWLFWPSKASDTRNAGRILVLPTVTPTSSGVVVGGVF